VAPRNVRAAEPRCNQPPLVRPSLELDPMGARPPSKVRADFVSTDIHRNGRAPAHPPHMHAPIEGVGFAELSLRQHTGTRDVLYVVR
jgi:hypothetical protein